MALRYLLDENMRGPLWRAILWHNSSGVYPLDVVRVGDPADLPLGTGDPAILLWAEREQRILVTHDADTVPMHLADHLAAGRHSPGVFMIRHRSTLPQIISFLRDAAYASDAVEWQDRIQFIP
jgi:predicted nuclease of predicted toxin-antitoxin system